MEEKEAKKPKIKRIDKKAEEILDLKDRMLRQQAEFENFKKRSKSELEDMARYGTREVIAPLLSVVDNFERAISKEPDGESYKAFYEGVVMIYKQMMEILNSQGLAKIEAKGQRFDPNCHEGVMNEPVSDEDLAGKVLEEFQTGYALNNKVIRPAMVKIGIKG